MRKLDDWCIAKFEAFSHWTQRNFGITSVTWERVSLLLQIFLLVTQDIPKASVFIRTIDYLIITFCLLRFVYSYVRVKSTHSGGASTANFEKVTLSSTRPWSFVLAVVFLPMDLIYGPPWFQCSVCALYFAACDDLPPGESRLSKLARSISAGARNLVPMPARRPI